MCAVAKGGHEVGKYLYSARLYKGDIGFRNRAVFCMCQQHPQYTKVGLVDSLALPDRGKGSGTIGLLLLPW